MPHPLASFVPTAVKGVEALVELALDLRWSWNHAADEVWSQLDPVLWALTHNPRVILQTVSRDRLTRLAADPAFRRQVEALDDAGRQAAVAPARFQQTYREAPLRAVAYFSMEFMLSEALLAYIFA